MPGNTSPASACPKQRSPPRSPRCRHRGIRRSRPTCRRWCARSSPGSCSRPTRAAGTSTSWWSSGSRVWAKRWSRVGRARSARSSAAAHPWTCPGRSPRRWRRHDGSARRGRSTSSGHGVPSQGPPSAGYGSCKPDPSPPPIRTAWRCPTPTPASFSQTCCARCPRMLPDASSGASSGHCCGRSASTPERPRSWPCIAGVRTFD